MYNFSLGMILSLAPATVVHSTAREMRTELIETYVDR